MPDSKISGLTPAAYLDGNEEWALAFGGGNERANISQILGGAFAVLQSNYTLANTTAVQKMFNNTANGALSLITGTYLFDCLLLMNSMSTTSGNAGFDLKGAGNAILGRVLMHASGNDTSVTTNAAAQGGSTSVTTSFAATMVTAGSGTSLAAHVRGTFDVVTAGTIIPSIAQFTAAAAVLSNGTYFQCRRIGPSSANYLGNWS